MPRTGEILAGLSRIANEAFGVALAWHVVVGLCVAALAGGFRPASRRAASLLSVPLASVSVVAWTYGNPFNGAVFALVAALLAWLARRSSEEPVRRSATWSFALGLGLIAFAWVYPHFFVARSTWAYLYCAPIGTIPCPTLALVSGAALIGGGIGPNSWQLVLASTAALYAVFGVLRLGVLIDAFLLVGAVGLFARRVLPI